MKNPIKEYLDAITKLGCKVNIPLVYLNKSNFVDPEVNGIVISEELKRHKFEIHSCYKNAYEFINHMQFYRKFCGKNVAEIRYCEGLMTVGGIPIEHGWVRIIFDDSTDVYVDPTKTYVLNESTSDFTDYAVMLEYTYDKLINTLLSKKCYGPYFTTIKY